MSEFECRNGHFMRAGQRVCWCGARLTYMDSRTGASYARKFHEKSTEGETSENGRKSPAGEIPENN